jgi:hypothetical protein
VVDQVPAGQHGFTPQKGIHTAWIEVLGKHLQNEDIFEYDLASFFNTVDLFEFKKDLVQLGIPKSLATYLFGANQSIPSTIKIESGPTPVQSMFAAGTDPELNQKRSYIDLTDDRNDSPEGPYVGYEVEETVRTEEMEGGKLRVITVVTKTPIGGGLPPRKVTPATSQEAKVGFPQGLN